MFDMVEEQSSLNKRSLAGELFSLLADVYTMSFRAQVCHWNVKGPEFYQYHAFFAMIYEDVYSSVDDIAENIRKIGFDAPTNLSDMCAATMIRDENMTSDPLDLTMALHVANEATISRIFSAYNVANEVNEPAISNYLQGRLDMHQKWAWQMKTTLGLDSQAMPGKFKADLHVTAPVVETGVEGQQPMIITNDSDDIYTASSVSEPGDDVIVVAAAQTAETRPIAFSRGVEDELAARVDDHNRTAVSGRRATLQAVRAVYRRGARDFVETGARQSRGSAAMRRVDAYLSLLSNNTVNVLSRNDVDLLPSSHPNAVTASATNVHDELSVSLKNADEYKNVEDAIVTLAEFSGKGYEMIPALRAAWKRAVNAGDMAYDRAYDLAVRLHDSNDSDLLPRTT